MPASHNHWKELADLIGVQITEPAREQPSPEQTSLEQAPREAAPRQPNAAPQAAMDSTGKSEKLRRPTRSAAAPRENHWRLISNELGVESSEPELPVSGSIMPSTNRSTVTGGESSPPTASADRPPDVVEEVDPLVVDQHRFVDEIDDIVLAAESQETDEGTTQAEVQGPEPSSFEEPVGEEAPPVQEGHGRRRRRRRGRRRRRDGDGDSLEPQVELESETRPSAKQPRDVDDEVGPEVDDASEDRGDSNEEVESGTRRRRSRWRRNRRPRTDEDRSKSVPDEPAKSADDEDDDDSQDLEDSQDDLDEDGEGDAPGRPRHKKIPSWSEAIDVIVAANLSSRERGGGRRGRRPNG